jgi:oxygen-independent coproporphyrinogen-3 oxidase
VAQSHEVSRAELPFEFMLNALRLKDGFDLSWYTDRTGLPLSTIEPALQEAQAKGWLERDMHKAKPSARGFDFLSDLQGLFLAG